MHRTIASAEAGPRGRDTPLGKSLAGELVGAPVVEVREEAGRVVVLAACPGVRSSDITLDVTPYTIVVETHAEQRHAQDAGPHDESSDVSSTVARSISLLLSKPIDAATTSATLRDGWLRVTATVVPEVPPRRIEVTASMAHGQSEATNRNPGSNSWSCMDGTDT